MLLQSVRRLARRPGGAGSVSSILGSSTTAVPRADDVDSFPLRERQESLLLERLPKEFTSASQISEMTGVHADRILMMKSGIGAFTGRALLLVGPDEQLSGPPLPNDVLCRPMDEADTVLFVEQCARLVEFTDDIRRLAAEAGKDGFNRVVTLSGVPKGYTRADLAAVISEATKGSVSVGDLRDIVFRFKKSGHQSDTAFVLLKTAEDALQVIKAVQEYAVPQRRVYGTSFGCSFVNADRSSLFISDPSLDYQLTGSSYWVMTLGWNAELDEDQMRTVLTRLAVFPNKIVKVNSAGGGEFLLRFDRMKNTKLVFSRLNRLKRRWRIPANTPFFAYPVRADIHFHGDEKHLDEASDCDSDLDEPIMY